MRLCPSVVHSVPWPIDPISYQTKVDIIILIFIRKNYQNWFSQRNDIGSKLKRNYFIIFLWQMLQMNRFKTTQLTSGIIDYESLSQSKNGITLLAHMSHHAPVRYHPVSENNRAFICARAVRRRFVDQSESRTNETPSSDLITKFEISF